MGVLFSLLWVKEGDSLELGDVGLLEVRRYIVFLQGNNKYDGHQLKPTQKRKLSRHSIRAHVENLKASFTWLYEEEYTSKSKLEELEFPELSLPYL